MDLNDEQYTRVLKYVTGEMNAAERDTFENDMARNKDLYEETVFCKKIYSLGESAKQKLVPSDIVSISLDVEDKDIHAMVAGAREKWERDYEQILKLKHGINTSSSKTNPVKINIHRWAAAAVLTGLVSLILLKWYNQNRNTVKNITHTKEDTSKSIIDRPPATERQTEIVKSPTSDSIQHGSGQASNINRVTRNTLFADNFQPDAAPPDILHPLREAFTYYNDSDYQNAVPAFEQSKTLITRGDEENTALTAFYTHYYIALSYMAMDSASKARINLKAAIAQSPDQSWKSKVQWYLALACLKTGDVKEAERILNMVLKNNQAGAYKQKSINLLKAIDMSK